MTGPPPGAPSGPGQGPGPVSGESGAERSGRSVSMVPLVGPVEGPVQATTAVARPGVETTTVVDRSRVRQAPPREQGPGGSGPMRVLYDERHCSPCKRRPTCGGAYTCMRDLTPMRAFEAARDLIEGRIA